MTDRKWFRFIRPARANLNRTRLTAERLDERDAPAVLYVAPSGADSPGRGTSPTAPVQSIQYAVNQSLNGDTILVAAGNYTYNPAHDINVSSLGTSAVVSIFNKQLSIYGGFSTTNAFATSNPRANPSTIDGGNQHRGVLLIGVNQSQAVGLDMNGFTIINGRATPIPARGGFDGIYAFGGGASIDFSDPSQRARQSMVRFANVTFANNQAVGGSGNANLNFGGAGAGGGLALKFSSDTRLENVIFRSNQAIGGGGAERGGVGKRRRNSHRQRHGRRSRRPLR